MRKAEEKEKREREAEEARLKRAEEAKKVVIKSDPSLPAPTRSVLRAAMIVFLFYQVGDTSSYVGVSSLPPSTKSVTLACHLR